eukprot:2592076-Rhodomonas_salina.1
MLKAGEGEQWVSLSSLFLTLSALSLTASMVVALIALEEVVNTRREEIDAIPDDEELKAYEQ